MVPPFCLRERERVDEVDDLDQESASGAASRTKRGAGFEHRQGRSSSAGGAATEVRGLTSTQTYLYTSIPTQIPQKPLADSVCLCEYRQREQEGTCPAPSPFLERKNFATIFFSPHNIY